MEMRRKILSTPKKVDRLFLFDEADNRQVTGGWVVGSTNAKDFYEVTQGEKLISIKHLGTRWSTEYFTYHTVNKIDISKFSKLTIRYKKFFYNPTTTVEYKGIVAGMLEQPTSYVRDMALKCDPNLLNSLQENIELDFDIAGFSGEYYFAIAPYAYYGIRGNSNDNYGLLWEIEKIYFS